MRNGELIHRTSLIRMLVGICAGEREGGASGGDGARTEADKQLVHKPEKEALEAGRQRIECSLLS